MKETEETTSIKKRSNREYLNSRKRRKIPKHLGPIIGIILIIIGIICVAAANSGNSSTKQPTQTKDKAVNTDKTAQKNNTAAEKYVTVPFGAVGDNLIHNTIYRQAAERSTGDAEYDFSYCYENIADIIGGTHLAFVNQETPLATAIKEPSNYPLFNTPTETVTALHSIGFNGFNLGTNHSLDMGTKGITATLDEMDDLDNIVHCGEYRNEQDLYKPHTITVDGITFAFIGITEMTNGISLPKDSEVKLVYTDEEDTIKKMIKAAEENADVTIVSCHWGTENSTEVTENQTALAQKIANWGGDLILGTHPHVLQKIETITTDDNRKVPVFYSMGNFISAMGNKSNHISGIFTCNIKVNTKTKDISVENIKVTPTICYFSSGYKNIRVMTYKQYLSDGLDGTHGLGLTQTYIDDFLQNTIGTDYLDFYGDIKQ